MHCDRGELDPRASASVALGPLVTALPAHRSHRARGRGGNTREKLRVKHVGPFNITGKPMKGWFMVEIRGWKTVDDLKTWLSIGSDYALTLPAK